MFRFSNQISVAAFGLLLSFASLWAAQAQAPEAKQLPSYVIEKFGTPPSIPSGEFSPALKFAVQTALLNSAQQQIWTEDHMLALEKVTEAGDPRAAWLMSDLLRFTSGPLSREIGNRAAQLLGIDAIAINHWGVITDHLIAWDIPAPPDYLDAKRTIFTSFVEGWENIFVPGDVDWRHVSWGGVLIDARAYDTTDEICNCIPAADNPFAIKVAEAGWLEDDDVVFGIAINGDARAYPRQIMEVREMVNDTLGGRDLGIPYCTLCGAAQAYYTDRLPEGVERPILRTSGLLIRSNKVMYDITSQSVFDTFTGEAVTGPLFEKGIKLEQASVVTTTWGAWKKAHPETTVLAESLALGKDFDFRNNRDADGPIFPVGDVDPRLPVHEDVIGIIAASGKPIAFQRSAAMLALQSGKEIAFENVRLELSGGGIRAVDADGKDLGSHQAFWFAWSQFHPETELWSG